MTKYASSEAMSQIFNKGKPFFAVIFLQFGFAGMDILSKVALNEGMSNYVFVVYRHAVATIVMAPLAIIFEKKIRPKMTYSLFIKFVILALLEPVIDQNLYIMGMKATTATFATAMANVLPAITFVMACILRLEKLNLKSIRSQAKVIGTLTTVAGAMLMTLMKGPILELFWTKGRIHHESSNNGVDRYHSLKGAFMVTAGCFSWAAFMVMQAITLKSYPAELSLTAWICLLGTAEGAIVALIMERGNTAVWAINWDTTLLATVYTVSSTCLICSANLSRFLLLAFFYTVVPFGPVTDKTYSNSTHSKVDGPKFPSLSGIVCSGLAYYIQGLIMKDRGPVFVTAFSPLGMIIVAVMGTIFLAEQMYLGRVIGAIVIVTGLYLVVWGKNKDDKVQSVPIGEQIAPEKQILDKEFEINSSHKVITIKASVGVPDDHNRTTTGLC